MSPEPVVIIGAGLAGLCCGLELQARSKPFLILEADNGPGGRVRTDTVDGFRLDRGFQVLLTAYPEARRCLDYPALKLRPYLPGALVRLNGQFRTFADPWRRPTAAVATAMSGVGTFVDKLRLAALRSASRVGTLDELFAMDDRSTLQELRQRGFSEALITAFFQPFLGGVFLDRQLQTSCRMLHFVFRMFSLGDTAIPADGMGEISNQLANRLPPGSIRYSSAVAAITDSGVTLTSGESIAASRVVIATDGRNAQRLLSRPIDAAVTNGVSCLYFAADTAPISQPVLVLNGSGSGPINNLSVPSVVSPQLAPAGKHLISVSVVHGSSALESHNTPGQPISAVKPASHSATNPSATSVAESDPAALVASVQTQLHEWFGPVARQYRWLKTYNIPHALPNRAAGTAPLFATGRLTDRLYIAGDACDYGSIHHAMQSGKQVAAAVAAN